MYVQLCSTSMYLYMNILNDIEHIIPNTFIEGIGIHYSNYSVKVCEHNYIRLTSFKCS